MFCFAFFWTFFHCSLVSSVTGTILPPFVAQELGIWGLPLVNTRLFLISDVTITIAHVYFIENRTELFWWGLAITLIGGIYLWLSTVYKYRYGVEFSWYQFLKKFFPSITLQDSPPQETAPSPGRRANKGPAKQTAAVVSLEPPVGLKRDDIVYFVGRIPDGFTPSAVAEKRVWKYFQTFCVITAGPNLWVHVPGSNTMKCLGQPLLLKAILVAAGYKSRLTQPDFEKFGDTCTQTMIAELNVLFAGYCSVTTVFDCYISSPMLSFEKIAAAGYFEAVERKRRSLEKK